MKIGRSNQFFFFFFFLGTFKFLILKQILKIHTAWYELIFFFLVLYVNNNSQKSI